MLNMRDGSNRHIPGHVLERVLAVKGKVEAVSGVTAELALVDSELPNAYATVHAGRPIVAVSLSYLHQFGSDADALAATIGHELAHLHLGHSADTRAYSGALEVNGNNRSRALSSSAREEERQADVLGMKWATAAGYDPCGQARLFRSLVHDLPTQPTHPGFAERARAPEAAAKKASGLDCR